MDYFNKRGVPSMIHMLVVDDEAEEREGILFLLHKYGFNMETGQAPNGKAALDYLKNRAVDILFTDVRMPFMDGLTLAKEALLLQPNIRVILFSGFSEFEYAKTAISLGVREYILKPVNVEEFCTVMQRVSAEILSRRGLHAVYKAISRKIIQILRYGCSRKGCFFRLVNLLVNWCCMDHFGRVRAYRQSLCIPSKQIRWGKQHRNC